MVGIELELDAARGVTLNLPTNTPGWQVQSDGSLRNGREMVLNPPLQLPAAVPIVESLCRKLVNFNVHKTGSQHVHVQAHDYLHSDAFDLVKLYTHFQQVLNHLVGQSRINNRYCPPYPRDITQSQLIAKFQLQSQVHGRGSAKSARVYSVVNCAMLRCIEPTHRTVEFRQGSVSKRAICVAGWATLMVALVDIAKDDKEFIASIDLRARPLALRPLFEQFLGVLERHERRIGATGLKTWAQWRYEYLHGTPTIAHARKLSEALIGGPKGLFGISKLLDTNLAFTKKLIDFAVSRNLVQKHPHRPIWQVSYDMRSGDDLTYLERMAAMMTEGSISEIVEDVEASVDAALNPPTPPAGQASAVPAPTP